MTRTDLEFNDEFKELLKKNHIPVWNMIRAWLCIEFDRYDEACEFVDCDDLKMFWDKKWKVNLFKGDHGRFKDFKNSLKLSGFGMNGLEGHYHKASYSLISSDLEPEFNRLVKRFPEVLDAEIVDKIIDSYRDYQEPGKQQYFIPKLSNFIKNLDF